MSNKIKLFDKSIILAGKCHLFKEILKYFLSNNNLENKFKNTILHST